MKRAVEQAVEEIRRSIPGCSVKAEPDPEGGAFVNVDSVNLGPKYEPSTSFIGFHITFQYPHSDVYPHFLINGLKRTDANPLGQGFHSERDWVTPSLTTKATMVSRRSNHLNPAVDTAATKLLKVIEWIRNQ